jgi:hypothetical protein
MEALWVRRGNLPLFLDLGTRRGWVVSSMPGLHFTPGEIAPSTHCIGGWVGPRAGLDVEARGKILYLCRGSNPSCPAHSQTLYWLRYLADTGAGKGYNCINVKSLCAINLHTISFFVVKRCSPTFEFRKLLENCGMWWSIAFNFMRLAVISATLKPYRIVVWICRLSFSQAS